ncbi:11965_t:CDS:2 [Funneliformis caledonium]|uniref:11965_t:CDS:1 n=1 Tax=Funneliformis caledonium TaxID=1117310 RepID=A0A9N9CAJ2_9GLOM|nr:11965_t:CDS:2 [Funneliformis caledonium]
MSSSINYSFTGEKCLPAETSTGTRSQIELSFFKSRLNSCSNTINSFPCSLTDSSHIPSIHLPNPSTLPLEFHRYILEEILSEDGLLILSRGLGLRRIICALIRIYSDRGSLVILLNANGHELSCIKEEIAEGGVKKPGLRVVNNESNAKERSELYVSGGILSITSRILIIDLLQKRIPTYLITGILIMHAERFHVIIRNCLEQHEADVIELHQSLSPSMNEIQAAITECIEACLSEIKKVNGNWLDVDDLTVENSFFRSFDVILRQQLEPFWHRVSSKTKLLVNDLTTLRKLLGYLVGYDCVSFNSFLETIITSQTPTSALSHQQQSPWLSLDAGNTIFSAARRRVFIRTLNTNANVNNNTNNNSTLDQIQPDAPSSEFPPGIQPILEELPKWNLLAETLQEIESDIIDHNKIISTEGKANNNTVLIMVENERECSQLREYLSTMHIAEQQGLSKGGFMLRRLLKNYFRWKSGLSKVSNKMFIESNKESGGGRNINSGKGNEQPKRGIFQRGQQPSNKRRRVRGGSSTATLSTNTTRNTNVKTLEEEAQEIANFINSNPTISETSSAAAPMAVAGSLKDNALTTHHSSYYDDEFDVYRTLHPDIPCLVYFMMYENSIEEQKYLSVIRREKEAFEKLIKEKSVNIQH